MICVSVTPVSRILAKADLLNAARMGDIVELCADHFAKEPEFADLIGTIDKPLIISCRRQQDGGQWAGSEEDRLRLLRQAIAAEPAYVELDLDIAEKIPRYGSTKRLISFVRLDRPETKIADVFRQANLLQADVVKFTWPTPNLTSAWPLLRAVTQKSTLPVVGMGLGRPELTFSLLGRRHGSPWIYAALEPGMESYPGQATVFELNETYRCQDINSKTSFVAVAGFGESQTITTRVLNAGFSELQLNVRCLPVEIEDVSNLKRMFDTLKIRAAIVGNEHGRAMAKMADHIGPHDFACGHVDLLLKRTDGWHGYNTLWRSALQSLQTHLETHQRPAKQQRVLVIGNGGIASSMLYATASRFGLTSICGTDEEDAGRMAASFKCRYVPFPNLYETQADVVVVADPELKLGTGRHAVSPSLLTERQTVLDVSQLPIETEIMQESRNRNAETLDSAGTYSQQVAAQFLAITGQPLPESAFIAGLSE